MTKRRVIGTRQTAEASGAIGTTEAMMAYIKQLVTAQITQVALDLEMPWHCCVKSDGAVLTGDDDLFDITGGPVLAQLFGIVTTVLVGTSNGDLQIDVTTPAGTVDLNDAPVAINADAAGTMYMCLDSTSVFTPVTAGAVIIDKDAAPIAEFVLPIGTVIFRSSAAQTGVIEWYMLYRKLSPLSTVVAAA